MLGKILSVATVGSALANQGLLHRCFFSAINVLVLAIVSAFMLCMLLIGSLALAYLGLIHYGVDPSSAGIVLGLLVLSITLILMAIAYNQMQKIRKLSHQSLLSVGSDLPDVGNIVMAFIDGFLNNKK